MYEDLTMLSPGQKV